MGRAGDPNQRISARSATDPRQGGDSSEPGAGDRLAIGMGRSMRVVMGALLLAEAGAVFP